MPSLALESAIFLFLVFGSLLYFDFLKSVFPKHLCPLGYVQAVTCRLKSSDDIGASSQASSSPGLPAGPNWIQKSNSFLSIGPWAL